MESDLGSSGDWIVFGFTFQARGSDGTERTFGKIGGYKILSDADPRLKWKQDQWLTHPEAFDWSTPAMQMTGAIFLNNVVGEIALNLLKQQMKGEVWKRESSMWQKGLQDVNLDPEVRDDKS